MKQKYQWLNREVAKPGPFLLGRDAVAQLYAENVVGTSTVIARTDLLRAVGGFDEALGQLEPGKEATIEILRGNERKSFQVTVGERPGRRR